MLEVALLSICACVIFIDALLIFRWSFFKTNYYEDLKEMPSVSILVAARNEENNIAECLDHLLNLDYPTDNLEILVGDDASSDQTFEIAQEYSKLHSHLNLIKIDKTVGTAKGKANVLAQLAQMAKGDIFFITDADVVVPPTWLKSMLTGLRKSAAIVNGFTTVRDNIWQNMDWIFSLGMVKVIHDMGRPVTAMGNNMLITREAYQSVGGYESIPFSITEDFELFKQVRKKGYEVVQMADKEIIARTNGQRSFTELLHQRKRWMKGAVELSWPIVSLLFIQAIYFPVILILGIFNLKLALGVFTTKMLLQSTFILMVGSELKEKVPFYKSLIYELYSMVISISSAIFYILPFKIIWKGRKY